MHALHMEEHDSRALRLAAAGSPVCLCGEFCIKENLNFKVRISEIT